MASDSEKRIIQLTGFKKQEKESLLKYLFKLDCVFLDNKQYRNCSHLIAKKMCRSEKFLAACAAGKWILTKEYIINSAESGRWLDETTYEWGYEIEKATHHYSPQRQSAPKRWREELAHSGAPGAFHRWKVLLLAEKDDKQMMSIRRVLQAGKATICSSQSSEHDITHVFVSNSTCLMQSRTNLYDGQCYPLQHIGYYLLENEIQTTEDNPKHDVSAVQETDETTSDMQLDEARNTVIRHMYFAAAIKHRFAQKDCQEKCSPEVKSASLSRGTWHLLKGLIEEYLIPDVITELAACQKYCTPSLKVFRPLLEYILLENTNAILVAKFFHVLYLVLQLDPPWKSPSMLKYYLDFLQCPVCKKGTWSLVEMLVRSCLYCKPSCHEVPVSGREDEKRIVHKTLLKFFADLLKAEVEFLTQGLVEGTSSQDQQVMPQTVLLNTFWPAGKTSALFTKHINTLADWVVVSQRELNRKNDAFRCEIAYLLNAILGTIVEYWIISGLLMDRNVFHQVADDLAHYLAISCDDFSVCNLKRFICSMTSSWLQMFVAEAVFKNLCLQRSITISRAPLSLKKIVCCYLPALQELGLHKRREVQKAESEKRKRRRRPCRESPRILQMPNSNKQNQVKELPDLPDLKKCPSLTMKMSPKPKKVKVEHKENRYHLPESVNIWKRNLKGETALHIACRSNKVERLIQLLSSPGIDINVKDYAGWTPMHEACNHGSTVCVREILQRCPEVDLLSQVDGVTPLHDALSNGHVEIAKLLLQHGGKIKTIHQTTNCKELSGIPTLPSANSFTEVSGFEISSPTDLLCPSLLQQRDTNEKLPLDYVESRQLRQELLNVVHPGENPESSYQHMQQDFCSQQGELWLTLFSKMLLNFCSVYNLCSPITFRGAACSNVLPGDSEVRSTYSADWLVDLYVRELETFEKLPQILQEIADTVGLFPGDQMKDLLATLQTMVEAYELVKVPNN